MKLDTRDKEQILSEFPNIKLSYENIIYKKVYKSDLILAVPEGKKCFAWFTTFNDKNVCIIMELSNNKNISDIKITNACFSNTLSYGTILYGTVIYHSFNRFFSIEDIFSYKGSDIARENWGSKYVKLEKMLKNDLKQHSYNSSYLVFGLPFMCNTNEELEHTIKNTPYKISSIQFRLFNRSNNYLFMDYNDYLKSDNNINHGNSLKTNNINHGNNLKTNNINHGNSLKTNNINHGNNLKTDKKSYNNEYVFLVRPDIQEDIYYAYSLNDKTGIHEEMGTLHIPDFNTSVMMNKLFRNIKENENLDALEESDEEDEFENEKIDRFVHLDRSHKIVCKYNYKFKRWYPIKPLL